MFRKSNKEPQLGIFSSPSSLLSGKSLSIYEEKTGWHNGFRQDVTNQIDEEIFKPLYCDDNGKPNASIRVLIAMMILKSAEGISDHKLYENCRFNMLTRSAIGLVNADDAVPTESTYYLFRKRVVDYAKATGVNLMEVVFQQVTKKHCAEFEVSGRSIRMDSKLLGSNIAWLTRYELIHETFRLFYNEVNHLGKLDKETEELLDNLLSVKGDKVTYTCSDDEVQSRLRQLGSLIYRILPLYCNGDAPGYYATLIRVFGEQYRIDENKIVIAREKEEIPSNSVQSPHDTDCSYRNKDNVQVKGYSINITESCDDGAVLNLIGHVDIRPANTQDLQFFQDDVKKIAEVFTSKTKVVHADGAYHSPENQAICKDDNIELVLNAIQGPTGRYVLELEEDALLIHDTQTNQPVEHKLTITRNGLVRWRIKEQKGYRYFTQKHLQLCLLRKKLATIPIEKLQKRNNVEATIFQLAYHYSNAKSRYRGLIAHQMWANTRCLWINFRRLIKFRAKPVPTSPSGRENTFQNLYRIFLEILANFFLKLQAKLVPAAAFY